MVVVEEVVHSVVAHSVEEEAQSRMVAARPVVVAAAEVSALAAPNSPQVAPLTVALLVGAHPQVAVEAAVVAAESLKAQEAVHLAAPVRRLLAGLLRLAAVAAALEAAESFKQVLLFFIPF